MQSSASTHLDVDLDQALEDLRHGALGLVAPGLMVFGWLWFLGQTMITGIATSRDIPAVSIVLLMTIVLLVRRRRPNLACWLFLPSLVLIQALMIRFRPSPSLIPVGIIGVILLSPVLGAWQAIVGAVLLGAIGVGTLWAQDPSYATQIPTTVVLYVLATGAVWLAGRSLRVAVSWALTGWQRAQEALQETRERRGELYRALHALEEATYRIERVNNELIIARTEAEEARAVKAHLLATVSHEIRGPLSLILGFSRLMALSPERYNNPLPADYRADVVTVYRNSQHLASLVDDILDLSQIEAERLPLIKERVDLEVEVIREAALIAEPLAQRKDLAITLDFGNAGAEALPPLLIDQVRIRQVVLNLLTNAIRFTESGGITLGTRLEEQRVVVSVADTGPGIPQESLGQLFKAFQQLLPAERSADKGSGLGLSISKQLVELHGGEIWVESQVGVGTTVSFSLPLPGMIERATSATKKQPGGRRSHGKDHVLILHQDPTIVKILGRYLEGYQVIGLPDETELLPMIEELHPRAVISTGGHTEVARDRLGQLDYDVPLIECAIPRALVGAAAEGVLSYLVKPISREMLSTALKPIYQDGEMTVLMVDDDPDALRLVEMMLLSIPQPYRILKAFDGAQALQIMETETPDLVLADLLMPGMGGEALIAHMREMPRLAKVPVVIISARDCNEESFSVGLPISISGRRALGISDAAACLQSLLKFVSPTYLPEAQRAHTQPEPVLPSAGAPLR